MRTEYPAFLVLCMRRLSCESFFVRLQANASFLKTLRDYDKDNIDARTIRRLQKYLTDPTLSKEKILGVNKVMTAPLCFEIDFSTLSHRRQLR